MCAKVCKNVCSRGKREPAIIMDKDNHPIYRRENCFFEGDCIRVCPAAAKSIPRIVRNTIRAYNRIAQSGERFGEALERHDIKKIKGEIL